MPITTINKTFTQLREPDMPEVQHAPPAEDVLSQSPEVSSPQFTGVFTDEGPQQQEVCSEAGVQQEPFLCSSLMIYFPPKYSL